MNKLNQKGLAHLGLIALTVALLITGTAGFLVYRTNNKNTEKKEDSGTSKESTDGSDTSNSLPSGYKLYKDEISKFTVFYPNNWSVISTNLTQESISTQITSPLGVSLNLISNPGGRGAAGDCTVDETTGKVKWTFADDSIKSGDPCPYTMYHSVKKLDSKIIDREGAEQDLYLVKQSVGLDNDRKYGVCIVPGPVTVDVKKYGINFIDTDFTDYSPKGIRFIKACVLETGDNINFFDRTDIKEAYEVLGSFKLN